MIPKEFETISEYVCKQTRWTDGSIRHDRMEDVVRCKDCIVFGTHGKNTDICPMWHNTHIDPYRDFCSRGVRKTENGSEKPNNCEHITEDGVTCAKYPACNDCLDNPLNKLKGPERLVKGSEQTDLVKESPSLVKDLVNAFCEDGTWLERQGVYTLTLAEAKQRAVDIIEAVSRKDTADTPQTDCDDRYAVRTYSGDVVAYACPLGCEHTDCGWGEPR